jgi:hypothetical protein
MSNVSIVKEALISSITASVVIPLLWVLSGAINPDRDAHSPGLDLVVLTLAGAVMVMLLRSTWRNTEAPTADSGHEPDDWNWNRAPDSYGRGGC